MEALFIDSDPSPLAEPFQGTTIVMSMVSVGSLDKSQGRSVAFD
jgi:hypothetical protein